MFYASLKIKLNNKTIKKLKTLKEKKKTKGVARTTPPWPMPVVQPPPKAKS
jgi:hypothetical protein